MGHFIVFQLTVLVALIDSHIMWDHLVGGEGGNAKRGRDIGLILQATGNTTLKLCLLVVQICN